VRGRLGPDIVNQVADDIALVLRGVVREIMTDRLMSIGLPDRRTLQLGRDVLGEYPADLKTITYPDLLALLTRYDAAAPSTRGSAAIDWSVLDERMHYIADFFRAYQADAGLLEPPFSPTQLGDIATGIIPADL